MSASSSTAGSEYRVIKATAKCLIVTMISFFICNFLVWLTNSAEVTSDCKHPSVTTASGHSLLKKDFCSGDIIFEDNFDTFDLDTWRHENTLSGGGNWEFQWYTNNRSNTYVKDGTLHICPTLTVDFVGENFLSYGLLNIDGESPADECTNSRHFGCERIGTPQRILNPIRSGRIDTVDAFSFKYGKVEVRAKLPTGDWLWPAVWLLPKVNAYGFWPASGEIDILESKGNTDMYQYGQNVGNEQVAQTLLFGPNVEQTAWTAAHYVANSEPGKGFNTKFSLYEMEWTPEYIKFQIDGREVATVYADKGFWEKGNFPNTVPNPWISSGPMAPFDQEFYIIMNVAVGSLLYFPDDADYARPKPWKNFADAPMTDFWNDRHNWLPTWNLGSKDCDAGLAVDYIRVYAL